MMFCPKCGSILMPKAKAGKVVIQCSCGYQAEDKENKSMEFKEEVAKAKEIEIVETDVGDKTLPETEAHCPKCGHNIAGYWLQQTRAGDEPPTKFIKCKKCGRVWREYS